MEKTQHFNRSKKSLASSIPSNLLQMKDTKESQNLFDYQNNTLDEEFEDGGDIDGMEGIEEVEFSEIMSDRNKTCQLDSLADELEFYDRADDEEPRFYGGTEGDLDEEEVGEEYKQEVMESEDDRVFDYDEETIEQPEEEIRYQNDSTIEEHLDDNSINPLEENKEQSELKEEILIQDQIQRKNTGTSSDIDTYMLCQSCMKSKGILYEKRSNTNSDSLPSTPSASASPSPPPQPSTSPSTSKTLAYLKSRNPMKEFFVLTAQAVKLNSPYMNSILNLHVSKLYEQVQKEDIPFYQWGEWIEDTLHRTIVKRIYSEAFVRQNMEKILGRDREERKEEKRDEGGKEKEKEKEKGKEKEKEKKVKKKFGLFNFLQRKKVKKSKKKEKKEKK